MRSKGMKPKHQPKYVDAKGNFNDQYECSCGWKSNTFWDLAEAAWDEWLLHAWDTKTPIDQQYTKRQQNMVKSRDRRLAQLSKQRELVDLQIAKLKGIK